MLQLLAVGGAVLAVLVVLNLLLTFALIGRLRALQEAVSQLPAARDPALPQPGDPVGPFQATTQGGESVSDSALRAGVTLVGFFTPGCRPCTTVREQLLASPPAVPMLAFVEGGPEDEASRTLAAALGQVARVAYMAEDDSVAKAFRQAGYPTLVRVEDGVVAAAGHHLHEVLP